MPIYNPPAATGGGGSPTSGTATLDFGAFPGASEVSVAVTGQAGITGTSAVVVAFAGDATSGGHTASDHKYAAPLVGLTVGTISAGVGFTIYGRCLDKMQGAFVVNWQWE